MRNVRLFGSVAVVLVCTGLGRTAETIRIVDRGVGRATVVVPANADPQTRQAAQLLAEYVERASGAKLPVIEESVRTQADRPVTIYVGSCAYVERLNLQIEGLDDDGFVIRGVDRTHLVIVGPSAFGTEFGACEFLERYLGVRWLMPGPDGDDVPQRDTVDVPIEEVRDEPAFYSRLFSGLTGEAQLTWARRNRMHGRVQFHHNLLQLFPPETYTKTHPHFFPIHDGGRYLPPTNDSHHWQPCFSADGIVDEAVRNICRYFDEHPEAPSYSLGVNDSGGHCECEECQSKDSGEQNFVGRRDVSDRYYQWCNRVIEGVRRKHPDKLFGCLAYSEVAQPPSRVKIDARLIPFMTYDRMKWIDPELRAEGRRMTARWHEASPVIGWYDYIYGAAYCVPRVWPHQMADYYRFGHSSGVRAMYAEAYPNWGEGPKLYVSLKLQWDPERDVDDLLREWHERAVGKDAAADLAAYYALWEDFWTRRVLESAWFTNHGQYLPFNDPSYLADVTSEDIAKSRMLLERVAAKAKTDKHKARAKLLMLAFEYYEASAVAYSAGGRASEIPVKTEADALAALDRGRNQLQMAAKRQRLVQEEFPKHPELAYRIDFDRYPLLRGNDWGADGVWSTADWAVKSDTVRTRLQELASSPEGAVSLQAKTVLLLIDDKSQPLSGNPSFENPNGSWPAPWSQWIKWGIGSKTADAKAARSGKMGVLCKGMKRGGPHQVVDVTAGQYAAAAYIRIPTPPRGNATITLQLAALDEQGQNLPVVVARQVRATACDWTRIAVAGQVPAEADGKKIEQVRLIVLIDGFAPGEEVHIDDVAMYRIE